MTDSTDAGRFLDAIDLVKKNMGDSVPDTVAGNLEGGKDVERELNAELDSDIKRASSAAERGKLLAELDELREKQISLGVILGRARTAFLASQLESVNEILAGDPENDAVIAIAGKRIGGAQDKVTVLMAALDQLSQNIKAIKARIAELEV